MNAKEDILNSGGLMAFDDYSVFRRRAPQYRGQQEVQVVLNRWYVKVVANTSKRIRHKYWICVCGYLSDNRLVQTSIVLNAESPRMLVTENSIYLLGKTCDILNQSPHPLFDQEVSSRFLGGFPRDWMAVIEDEICRIIEVEARTSFHPRDPCANIFSRSIEDILEEDPGSAVSQTRTSRKPDPVVIPDSMMYITKCSRRLHDQQQAPIPLLTKRRPVGFWNEGSVEIDPERFIESISTTNERPGLHGKSPEKGPPSVSQISIEHPADASQPLPQRLETPQPKKKRLSFSIPRRFRPAARAAEYPRRKRTESP